jgi:hypothetical protein
MEALEELIKVLSDPQVSIRNGWARATHTCKICEKNALKFRNASSEFEYRISAICQNCQDKYFHYGNDNE